MRQKPHFHVSVGSLGAEPGQRGEHWLCVHEEAVTPQAVQCRACSDAVQLEASVEAASPCGILSTVAL